MNIQLSISLLASDRMETLGKCLESISPLLRELNSELIVVTTGKDPKVTELVQKYTSSIIPFTWCDDFSKARNAGLKGAGGEWFLYIDDDEWFENTDEIIEFFKSGEYLRFKSATYVQRNYHNLSGKEYTDAHVGRMCQLTSETKFIYPIHEQLSPLPDPQKRLHSYVHHFGYAGKAVQKSDRNLPLLLEMAEENPTAQLYMQITQEYRNRYENENALEYCRRGLRLAEKEKRIHMYELWMQVHIPVLLVELGRMEEALKEGERILNSPRTLEVGEAHLHAILAGVCWEIKEYKKGLEHSCGFHEKMRYLQRHPEKAERQVGGTITFETARERAMSAYVAGLLFASSLNEPKKIKEILTWIPWEDTDKVRLQYKNLDNWKYGHPEHKDTILEGYYRLDTDNTYVCLQKALYAENKNMPCEMENFFRLCAENCPEGYMHQLVELAERSGLSLKPLFEHSIIEEWDECARTLAEQTADADLTERLQRLQLLMADYPLCFGREEQYFMEKKLSKEFSETRQLIGTLQRYCKSIVAEADILYKKEILDDPGYYALPSQTKFALYMERVLDNLESGNYRDAIPFLQKALHALPQMSVIVSRLSEYLEEKMNAPQQPVSEEFAILGKQVKQMLLGLMENGQWREAYGVADQLITLLPGDLEILKLKQEIMGHL